MAYNEELTMMLSVAPGSLSGISALMSGLSSINNVFTDMTRQIDANFGLIDATVITATTIIAQFGFQAAQSFGEFEQGMKVAQMVSGQTAQEMDYLKQKANEFSVSYRADIDQITEGLQTLGRAGLNSASEQTEVLQNGLSTAKLEGRDLNSVLEELIQNTALLGGNLKSSSFGEDSGYVNDMLVATSMTAPITTHDVSETLKYSGGIAAAAGANIETEENKRIFEDYLGAIAAFAQKGVTGSIAGTALRAFFNKPATQDSSVTDALATIHLKPEYLWEDDEETMKPVSEQIGLIEKQMEDLNVSTMDRLQIWSKIVGGKMGQQMMKLHSEDIQEITKDIRTADSAESLAEGTFKTFQSKMKEVTEQGQVAFREFGKNAAAVLAPILDIAKMILQVFSNPIVSGVAFIGSFGLIVSGINKIRNVIKLLKEELRTAFHYMATGENLYAVRPSTERKNNRFKKEELQKRYPGLSPITAYEKEKQLATDESLLKKYTEDEIIALRKGNRLKSSNFVNASVRNKNYRPTDLYHPRYTGLPSLDSVNDSYIVKTLVENGAWEEKYSNQLYESGGDIKQVLMNNIDEIQDKIYNINQEKNKLLENKSKEIKSRKMSSNNSEKNAIFSDEDAFYSRMMGLDLYDDEGNLDQDAFYNAFHDYFDDKLENEKTEHLKKKEMKEMELLNPIKTEDIPFFPTEDEIYAMYGANSKNIKGPSGEKLDYGSVNVKFDNIKSGVQNKVIGKYIDDINESLGGYLFSYSDEQINLFLKDLGREGKLPSNPGMRKKFTERIWQKVLKERTNLMNYFTSQISDDLGDRSLKDIAVLNQESFHETVNPYVRGSGLDMNEFHRFIIKSSGLASLEDLKHEINLRQSEYGSTKDSEGFKSLLTTTGLYRLYDGIDPNLKSLRDVELQYDSYGAATRSELDEEKKEEFNREKERLDKREKLAKKNLQKRVDENINLMKGYWNPDDLRLSKDNLEDKKRFIPLRDFKPIMNQIYGEELTKKVFDGVKWGRDTYTDAVAPYFMDWRDLVDKKQLYTRTGELKTFRDTTRLKRFAADVGVENAGSINNENKLIGLINQKLTDRYILNQIEDEKQKILDEKNAVYQEDISKINPSILNWQERREHKVAEKLDPIKEILEDIRRSVANPKDKFNQIKKDAEERANKNKYETHMPQSNEVFETTKKTSPKKPSTDDMREVLYGRHRVPNSDVNDGVLRRIKAEEELSEVQNRVKERNDLVDRINPSWKNWQERVERDKPELTFFDNLKNKFSSGKSSIKEGFSTMFEGIKNNLNADRTGNLLNFGAGSRGNKFLNGLDMLGGPMAAVTAGFTALSFVIDYVKGLYEDYCNKLKEAGEKLTEAYSKLNSADSALERTFKEGNPDATQDDIDQMMYDTYAEMGDKMAQSLTIGEVDWLRKLGRDTETGPKYEYDEEAADGTMKETQEELTDAENYEKALKENTGALYAAASEVSTALNNYVRISQDSWWGTDGWTGWVTDQWGGFMDKLSHSDTWGSTFTGNNNEFLLTQSQADENYSGYKEMAGLMMEDFKDAGGEWLTGMKTMMGEDAQELSNALGQSTKDYLRDMARFSAGRGPGSLNATQNAKIQQSMKQDPKTWKKLGKELAKRDTNKKLGKDITKNQNRIKGLTEKIRSTVGKGFHDSQIQRAAYIQQMQDMKQIADQAIVPIMQTNLGIAGQTLSATGQVGANTGNTVNTTGSTNENAAVIAGLVAIIARQSAKAQHFDDVLAGGEDGDNDYDGNPGTPADKELYKLATKDGMNADKFYQENMKNYNSARGMYEAGFGSFGGTNKPIWERGGVFSNTENDMAGGLGYVRLIEATAKMTGYGYDKISAMNTAREFAEDAKGKKLNDIFATVDKNYTQSEQFKNEIVNAYLLSNDDDGSGSGGGGGGGGGDSGDKDNTGTKKERVDLVLCSKKEIPKLNVNLFKKPPTFTVLNKNFKLRDVKINTEDTPKAIMSSIKNAFIDVQKRSDPKIIQDEEAEYDPKEATDGNALPSGSAKTKTDT